MRVLILLVNLNEKLILIVNAETILTLPSQHRMLISGERLSKHI